jgi:hypothetical protein
VWADRYHAKALTTPRQVRNAIIYVLRNHAKHGGRGTVDPRSSSDYFDGWQGFSLPSSRASPEEWPVAAAETWLLEKGWRRLGAIRADELPARGIQN